MYVKFVRWLPDCKSLSVSLLKVEKVLKPPQKPTTQNIFVCALTQEDHQYFLSVVRQALWNVSKQREGTVFSIKPVLIIDFYQWFFLTRWRIESNHCHPAQNLVKCRKIFENHVTRHFCKAHVISRLFYNLSDMLRQTFIIPSKIQSLNGYIIINRSPANR